MSSSHALAIRGFKRLRLHAAIRVALLAHSLLVLPAPAQTVDAAFFETKIRPVLATRCFACHSSQLAAPRAELSLDTKSGLSKGSVNGPVVVPGKPEESKLIQAIRYANPSLQMPPTGKLPENVIADFENWVRAGAPDPRQDPTTTTKAQGPLRGMSIEDGKKWWAFQALHPPAALPTLRDRTWARQKIDNFILAKLEEKNLKPSPEADKTTLARRLYVDVLGYKPTYAEIDEFVKDTSPDAYEKLVTKLLASPHYGERWARNWLDVARYGEDNSTAEATNPGYPYAYRYRDWVIEALNADMPYDRFVKMQLAADLMPDAKRGDMRALGYLGASPVYHKDMRLSKDVIYGFMTDDWDERVDAVGRGLLAMTIACARCHDHKFDAIPTRDYYGLAGVFASTMRAQRPMFDVEPQVETRYLWIANRLFDLSYAAGLMIRETSTIDNAAQKLAKVQAEIQQLKTEMEAMGQRYPQLAQHVSRYWTSGLRPLRVPADPDPPRDERQRRIDQGLEQMADPFMNAVFDASQTADGSDRGLTWIDIRPGEARDLPVMRAGNVNNTGPIAPRHFLTVLSPGDATFKQGSGRLELGNYIFSDGSALAARVIVNRVWGWHFGRPLSGTPSDFGVQGETPTHPELLEDLASRFIANGWSFKWLHREILLSAAYRQASKSRPDGEKEDQVNTLLWRMNPRRLDIESYRDSMLRAAGVLNEDLYGFADEVDNPANLRRTIYGRVSRRRLNPMLKNYDFPDPVQSSGGRILTTTSLQQLYALNSEFFTSLAGVLADSVESQGDNAARVTALYRGILSRDPGAEEIRLALDYLQQGTLKLYAQILLATNEEIFLP